MKRTDRFRAAVERLRVHGPDMAEQDRVSLEQLTVGEFEDLIPTYRHVSSDPVTRLRAMVGLSAVEARFAEEESTVIQDAADLEVSVKETEPTDEKLKPEVVAEKVETKQPAQPKRVRAVKPKVE